MKELIKIHIPLRDFQKRNNQFRAEDYRELIEAGGILFEKSKIEKQYYAGNEYIVEIGEKEAEEECKKTKKK